MRDSNRQWLINFLKTHYLNEEYTFSDLFYQYYSELEFESIDEYISEIDEFFDFLLNHISFMKYTSSTIPEKIPSIIEGVRGNAKMNFSGNMFESQKAFATQVAELLENPTETKVLDVGPGHFPISSLFLAKKTKQVTAMDAYFFLSQQALQNMNVMPLNQLFDTNTDISNYDIVVGRAPCSAIRPIVIACQKANKPYFLHLCDCALPPAFKANTTSLGWENMLPNIDPNIRFHGQYAFNLDISPEKIRDVLSSYSFKEEIRQKRYSIKSKEKKEKPINSLEDLFIFD